MDHQKYSYIADAVLANETMSGRWGVSSSIPFVAGVTKAPLRHTMSLSESSNMKVFKSVESTISVGGDIMRSVCCSEHENVLISISANLKPLRSKTVSQLDDGGEPPVY